MPCVIWKWELAVIDEQVLEMPFDSRVLSVQVQNGKVMLWALCDNEERTEKRKFYIYGTGHSLPDDPGMYIATFQLHSGSLVFHVFEKEVGR